MLKYTLEIDGMMCGMCEAHMNEAVRNAFSVKKVTSSHSKGTTVIITEDELSEDAIRDAIAPTGYQIKAIHKEPAKKGLFGW